MNYLGTFQDPNKIGFTSYFGGTVLKKTWFDSSSLCKGVAARFVSASDKERIRYDELVGDVIVYIPSDFYGFYQNVRANTSTWLGFDLSYNKFFQSSKVKVHVGFFLTIIPDYKQKKIVVK